VKLKIKKIGLVFVISFILNLVWENIHSILYLRYQGGPITEFILARAALSDAVYITFAGLIIITMSHFKYRLYLATFLLLVLSVMIEKIALESSRWVYKDIMPIVPILKVGLTPAIQLALLGHVTFKVTNLQSLTKDGRGSSMAPESHAS
jgi:hypothetical protein